MRALRAVLIVIFLVGIAISLADLAAPSPQHTSFILDLAPIGGQRSLSRLTTTDGLTVREGEARAGDTLRLLDADPAARLFVVGPGTPLHFVNLRTGAPVTLVDTLPRAPSAALWKLLRVAIEITALVLLFLRGTQLPVIGLATFLFFNQFTSAAITGAYLGVWWRVAYRILQSPLSVSVTGVGLVVLASGFAAPSRGRRIALRFLIGSAIAWIVAELALTGRLLAGGPYVDWEAAGRWMEMVLAVGALGLFARGIARTHGIERRRLVVLALAAAIGVSADLYGFFGPSIYNELQGNLALAAAALMTAGLAYAILVDRLFDIGFVINRAVVLAIISAIVLPVFVLIELLVGEHVKEIGTVYGTVIGLGGAVAIGMFLRPLHRRVDVFVDQVLFAARHRNANAILSFAEDCDEIETRERLLDRTVETVRRFGRVVGCGIMLADDHGNLREAHAWNMVPQSFDRDSLVTLRLRNSRRPLERGAGSPLDCADVAFPIPGRHRLAGVLMCERPPRAEPYSPEEFEALRKLAHNLGTALLVIDAAEARRLRGELATLRERARRSSHQHHR
jgi:hypothetical protein